MSLPDNATWDDCVAAHGGPDSAGWWITLVWYGEAPEPSNELIGPYHSFDAALEAMQASVLIDSIAEDTDAPECLEDIFVEEEGPVSIAETVRQFGPRVTLIDPTEPAHYGATTGPAAKRRDH